MALNPFPVPQKSNGFETPGSSSKANRSGGFQENEMTEYCEIDGFT